MGNKIEEWFDEIITPFKKKARKIIVRTKKDPDNDLYHQIFEKNK